MSLVSENIRYLRKLNGLTQEQFSRKINIKRSLLGAYEEGRANPNQQNMTAIAKAFNTTIELLTRQDLRKLRETPSLSIPLGQPARHSEPAARVDGSSIRSDGKIDRDSDPFQHPDFPDIFGESADDEPTTPMPQPLAKVLNKYYQEAPVRETRTAPAPPIITPPVRPSTADGVSGVSFQPVSNGPANDPLFSRPESRPAAAVRSADMPSFNRNYESPAATVSAAPAGSGVAIPVVMQTQFVEYSQRYQQAEFVHQMPVMSLPTLTDGHYRAFEAGADFTFPGALLVGQFVRNWFDIADGKFYVVLTAHQGICSRRVYNQVKIKGSLLLTADRADTPNLEIGLKDVLEVWEICAFVSQQLPPPVPSTDRLRQLVDELRLEVGRF
ncbi:helix-turn-helix domain-containing protein [Spirosoma rhododendri]|uniref:Helix-turn-helix transcriptional regulator n=1 Tax=Spirosoma rhododendri TaxID=2728024 RepID=A0A7L5DV58_9BACT|nr:helix-turn-helix transcriptional regulator [Spirosoma rhododendri]QJD80478.1 helix-turn-helix transcriptional regulator [Spirosoma rhododendri]